MREAVVCTGCAEEATGGIAQFGAFALSESDPNGGGGNNGVELTGVGAVDGAGDAEFTAGAGVETGGFSAT